LPAGHIKVDQSGFYLARALDSASEATPTPDQSSIMHRNLLDQVDGRYANQQSNVQKSNRPEKSDESVMLNFEGSK